MSSSKSRSFIKMSSVEMQMAFLWFSEDAKQPEEFVSFLNRGKRTLTRIVVTQREREPDGRPKKFTAKEKSEKELVAGKRLWS